MTTLIEKIAAYKNATQGLIDKGKEYETFIKENVPYEFWKKFDIEPFGRGQNEEYHVSINGKYVPSYPGKFGKEVYWGGDFNCLTEYVTGKELIEWAKGLPLLMQNSEEFIQKITTQAEELSK